MNSYSYAITQKGSFKNLDENDITGYLISFMKLDPISNDFKIDITREHYIDEQLADIVPKSFDKSPRIDIRFMNWTFDDKVEYFMEAKNLYEINWKKDGNKSFVNAKKYNQRYIETGMGNFISKRYPMGCLIGFVLQGSKDGVCSNINELLKASKRATEVLVKDIDYNHLYLTTHSTIGPLKHFLLEFN